MEGAIIHNPTTRWLIAIGTAVAEFGALYLWRARGIEPAGNLFIFWCWFVAVVGCMQLFIPRRYAVKGVPRRLRWFQGFSVVEDVILVFCLVWISYFVLAATLVVGVIGLHSRESLYDDEGRLIEEGAPHA